MMIKNIILLTTLTTGLLCCNTAAKKEPVTDTDVATTFIRGVLDNDFKTAQQYLLKDETNTQFFETFRHQYQLKDKSELEKYKAADIIINSMEPLKDTTIINYSNSYKKEVQNKLRLVRSNGQWLIDLKYTFSENQ
jgi:PhoPQ-activated pathogenicity-related protein